MDGLGGLASVTEVGGNIEISFKHVYSHTNKSDNQSIGNDIADFLAKLVKKNLEKE